MTVRVSAAAVCGCVTAATKAGQPPTDVSTSTAISGTRARAENHTSATPSPRPEVAVSR
ncbi:Uncharacterised protein [Mycobacteroides abscessus]|nr:Uncharacterised protein [Mycobacteroides abscessus]